MRALAALLAVAALLAAAAGCSSRERANPFDPRNPSTGGRPPGFAALAGDQTVTLRWSSASTAGLIGYRIDRAVGPDSGFRAISDVLPPNTSSYRDFGLANGVDHRYRLYFIFQSGQGSLPAEDTATPGPLSPWVSDYGAGTLARLTADGRHVAEVVTPVPGGTPSIVDVDIPLGAVWACDPTSGSVCVYRPSVQSLAVYRNGFNTPRTLAVDSTDHTAWIGDSGFNLIQHVGVNGEPVPGGGLFAAQPLGLALDPVSRALWICERDGDRVRYLDQGVLSWATGVVAPSHVAIDSVTHFGWVTSFSRADVVVLDPGGARLDSIGGFDGPIGIAVDSRRGRIWVCDPNLDRVRAFRRNRTEEFSVGGLAGAHEIAVDPATGEAWVTLGLGGAVARLSPAGAVLQVLGGFSEPFGIALDVPAERAAAIPRPAALAGPSAP